MADPRVRMLGQRVATADLRTVAPIATSDYGKGLGGRPWRRLRDEIAKRDRYTCQACKLVTLDGECDHVVPRAEGGSDDASNLQWMCVPCHSVKSDAEAARGRARA